MGVVGVVSLQGLPQKKRTERLWRDVFCGVCHCFYYIFYAMEQCQLLNIDNIIHMFLLHLIFIPHINHAPEEYEKLFNDHKIRAAGNWSPNQLWHNGILDSNSPLPNGALDEDPQDLDLYAEGPHGPTPFEGSGNNVIVSTVELSDADAISSSVFQLIDPLAESSEMGIDIFVRALEHIKETLVVTIKCCNKSWSEVFIICIDK